MRILVVLLLATLCVSLSSGFLFKKKVGSGKDGCDPNPCKNKAECVLTDKKDVTKFKCECSEEYVGATCADKAGCRTSFFSKDGPCGKHGLCTNDPQDPTEYHCECEKGYVGKDCDIVDKCLASNPCKADSECTLDAKFKPVCGCKVGFTGKKCDQRDCK